MVFSRPATSDTTCRFSRFTSVACLPALCADSAATCARPFFESRGLPAPEKSALLSAALAAAALSESFALFVDFSAFFTALATLPAAVA